MKYTLLGQIVLPDSILPDGAVCVSDGIIKYVGQRTSAPICGEVFDTKAQLISPGFVDIHCHAGGSFWAYEEPEAVAQYHLEHGTTGLLLTLYRTLCHKEIMKAINDIKEIMNTTPSILGVHMEGPYLNPVYGSKSGIASPVEKEKYLEIAHSGIIKQWTFSPEVESTNEFLQDIMFLGIVPAMGHSAASAQQVFEAAKKGVKIVTHLFNATGCSITPTRYHGTQEVSFDMAALLCDTLQYELICDSRGIHVHPELIKLAIKTAGIDKIIAITDCCIGDQSESDVNFIDEELLGSKLTMDKVSRNLLELGISVPDIFKITALNPAKAIGMNSRIGSITTGYIANLLVLNDKLEIIKVYKANIR